MNILEQKISNLTAKIAILGGGYVGLPLAVEFAKAGFYVTILDINESKILDITNGVSYIPDVPTKDVNELVTSGKLKASSSFQLLEGMDVVIICVPTPLNKTRDPDIQYIIAACESITKYLHTSMLISLESSTFPGTTDELMLPMFQKREFKVGNDFYLCFSPERVDPGNKTWNTTNIPKVVGGITPQCTIMGELLYQHIMEKVITVKSTKTAEMVKLLENTFRLINIGLVNELAMMCDKMGIDIWEVIDAAKTKPFGFMSFSCGPGIGGHCIAVDPFYFTWKAKQYGLESRFIETAGYINAQMPHHVVQKIQDGLNGVQKSLNGSHVHILGMAYKKDIDDVRESPALDIAHLLTLKGATVTYYDPYIPKVRFNGTVLQSLTEVPECDCVLIATDHSCFDYAKVLENAPLVMDSRNALKGFVSPKIVRL